MKPRVTIVPMMVTVVTTGVQSYGVGVGGGALTCMHVARSVMRVEQINVCMLQDRLPCLAYLLFREYRYTGPLCMRSPP